MPAPYTITDQAGGAFTLARNTAAGAPEPTAEELGLANAIDGRLRWVHDNPDQIPDPAAFTAALRVIADLGLARDPGRDPAAARQQFSVEFGDTQPDAGLPPPGAFRVYLDAAGEIRVERIMGSPDPTDEQRKYLSDLIQQERLVRALYERGIADETRRAHLLAAQIQRLAWAAGLGLEGRLPDVALARIATQAVLADAIQTNGAGVRGAYLGNLAWTYTVASIGLTVLTLLFYLFTRCANVTPAFAVPGQMLALMDAALLSLAVGAWLIAAFRLQPDSPEILTSLFATTTSSTIRVALMFGFGFLGLLLFHKQVIVFSFGPNGTGDHTGAFTTAQVFTKLSAAVLAGGLLGLGDVALPNAVIARSSNLVSALAPR